MKNMNSKKRIFLTIVSSYLLVLMIPLLSAAINYRSAIRFVRDSSEREYQTMLSQVQATVDIRLRELESISYFIRNNPNVDRLISYSPQEEQQKDIYMIYDVCRNIPDFSLVNNIVERTDIVVKDLGYVLSDKSAVQYEPRLHSHLCGYTGLDYEEWNRFLWEAQYYNRFCMLGDNGGALFLNSLDGPVT